MDIHAAELPDEIAIVKGLFQEYAESLNFDLVSGVSAD
jgi:hypothetical protein